MPFFEIIIFSVLSALLAWCFYDDMKNLTGGAKKVKEVVHPFSVSEYLSRIEKAADDITREYEREDPCTVLWWGLDGLKLNSDGTIEWIRKYARENVQTDSKTIDVSTLEDTSYKFIIGGPGGRGAVGGFFPAVGSYPQYYWNVQQYPPYIQPQYMGTQQSIQALESQIQSLKQKQHDMAVENAIRTLRGM